MDQLLKEPPATGAERKLHPLAYGIERIGLVSLRFPYLVAALLTIAAILAAFGIGRIKVDDSLSQLFRPNTPEFRQYEEVTKRFPSSEYDVLVVVEGTSPARPRQSRKIARPRHRPATGRRRRAASSRCFRPASHPRAARSARAAVSRSAAAGAAYEKLIQRVMSNEIIRGKLLSDDGKLALVGAGARSGGRREHSVAQRRRRNPQDDGRGPAGSGLTARTVRRAGDAARNPQRARARPFLYNALGFLAGCVIAILFFRRVSFMIMAAGPPLLAIVLALGALGWLGFRLNMFLNVMTPLIMVISFSDSMQLTFAARDRMMAGRAKADGVARRHSRRRAGLRADPCDGGAFLPRADVLEFGPDPHFRRSGLHRDPHRAGHGALARSRCSACCSRREAAFVADARGRGYRRRCAAPFLRLGRRADGAAAPASTACSA